jgi:hypothetical protein
MSARVSDGLLAAAEARAALGAMFARAWGALEPAPPLSIIEWAETYRVLSPEETSMPGRYSLEMTPALRGILAAASDPDVRRIASQKSAQVGYTAGVVCNVLGYHIHWRPSVQVVMFPREKSAKDFATEKLEPMLRATPVLAERVNLRTRRAGEGATRRRYEGGLLKLVAQNIALLVAVEHLFRGDAARGLAVLLRRQLEELLGQVGRFRRFGIRLLLDRWLLGELAVRSARLHQLLGLDFLGKAGHLIGRRQACVPVGGLLKRDQGRRVNGGIAHRGHRTFKRAVIGVHRELRISHFGPSGF